MISKPVSKKVSSQENRTHNITTQNDKTPLVPAVREGFKIDPAFKHDFARVEASDAHSLGCVLLGLGLRLRLGQVLMLMLMQGHVHARVRAHVGVHWRVQISIRR